MTEAEIRQAVADELARREADAAARQLYRAGVWAGLFWGAAGGAFGYWVVGEIAKVVLRGEMP